ncbi:Mu transposase domain-containing protein [Intestinibacter sp.]|uniref:Mu transposase domain-containing protein n=1 Tax=Intestinibacter sp. TaxID=1965304 RepID=UPI003F161A07
MLLFQTEKEYLHPLPDNSIIQSHMDERLTAKVHKDGLINYRNCKYSVPSKYIKPIKSSQS